MPDPVTESHAAVWILAAFGRLAGQGLLHAPAPADDPIAVASQRLLMAAGWLDADPPSPSPRLRGLMSPETPLAALAGYADELLRTAMRCARGAPGGWRADDQALIRWRSTTSAAVAGGIFDRAFAVWPGTRARLAMPGAAFLDVGVGGAGISIAMCRRFPTLRAVGLDINPAVLGVARDDIAAAGLADRIELRHQSVVHVDDVAAFDLIWIPQPFLSEAVLTHALPALHRAARPGAVIVMPLATGSRDPVLGASLDLHHLMLGGGTMSATTARELLDAAGLRDVRVLDLDGNAVMLARAGAASRGRSHPA